MCYKLLFLDNNETLFKSYKLQYYLYFNKYNQIIIYIKKYLRNSQVHQLNITIYIIKLIYLIKFMVALYYMEHSTIFIIFNLLF